MTADKFTDTLAAWWNNAEQGIAKEGDLIVIHANGAYVIECNISDYGREHDDIRILERAPQPKPAWHDAVAVVAHRDGHYGLTQREVYVPGAPGKWESSTYYAKTSDLVDVTPLIEQKVTQAAVERVWDVLDNEPPATYAPDLAARIVSAALGVDQ